MEVIGRVKFTQSDIKNGINALRHAREVLKGGKKWIQGAGSDGRGGFCMIGAIDEATEDSDTEEVAHLALNAAIQGDDFDAVSLIESGDSRDAIATFNDEAGRKYGEVSRAFQKAERFLAKQQIG